MANESQDIRDPEFAGQRTAGQQSERGNAIHNVDQGRNIGGPSELNKEWKELLKLGLYGLLFVYILGLVGLILGRFVIGRMFFNACQLQPLLRVFVFVDAVALIIFYGATAALLVEVVKVKKAISRVGLCCYGVLALFMISWLICGTVWVTGVSSLKAQCPTVVCTCSEVFVALIFFSIMFEWVAYALLPLLCVGLIYVGAVEEYIKRNLIDPEERGKEEQNQPVGSRVA